MPTAALLVTENCFASSLHGIIDALGCASYAAAEIGQDITFETTVVSPDGRSVQCSNGHTVNADQSIEDLDKQDVAIVVPSLAPDVTDQDVTDAMEPIGEVLAWLRHELARGTMLASSCTGAFLLAEAGLLKDKQATTHWRSARVFRERYPDVILKAQDLITDNGSLMCGGGASSHIVLSLHLIRRYGGDAIASHCAHTLVVDPGRNLQSPYALMTYSTDHADILVSKAQEHIARQFRNHINSKTLSAQLNVSERTLTRRFKNATGWPIGLYIQSTRIEAARNKLATSGMPLQSIVTDVGYEDFSSFARLFKSKTGLTMQSYRERFRL